MLMKSSGSLRMTRLSTAESTWMMSMRCVRSRSSSAAHCPYNVEVMPTSRVLPADAR